MYYIQLNAPGTKQKILSLANTGSIAWLKYLPGHVTTLNVYAHSTARLILTDQLTGCSFGVMKGNLWSRVVHSNITNGDVID
ncbi:hypothetical protein JZU48_04485, partial [bacterium]|nr:hypothetical protein [bacterium]